MITTLWARRLQTQRILRAIVGTLAFSLITSACLLRADGAFAADAPAIQEKVVSAIDARSDQAVELLRTLVDINSGTLNLEGVRRVSRVIEPEFAGLGFTTEWIDGASFKRAGHLIARRAGGDLHVLLIGHLDTVFESESPFQRFESLDDTHASGPGTTDMKGGIIVMLEVLHALNAVDALNDLTVTVVLTGDEESSGRPLEMSRAALISAGVEADIALGFEDGDGDPKTAVIARRGSARWHLETRGIPSHSSQIFTDAVGAGAIHEAARVLEAFRQGLTQEEDLTYNPGLIVGGTEIDYDPTTARVGGFGKNNVVAEFATVTGDLRTTSPAQFEYATSTMQAIVAESLPGCSAQLTVHQGYPAMAATDGNRRLLAIYSRASEDLGFGPVSAVNPRRAGAADISFVAGDVEMALDGLGLMGAGGHTVDEVADLTTLPNQAKRVALLLYRLSHQPRAIH